MEEFRGTTIHTPTKTDASPVCAWGPWSALVEQNALCASPSMFWLNSGHQLVPRYTWRFVSPDTGGLRGEPLTNIHGHRSESTTLSVIIHQSAYWGFSQHCRVFGEILLERRKRGKEEDETWKDTGRPRWYTSACRVSAPLGLMETHPQTQIHRATLRTRAREILTVSQTGISHKPLKTRCREEPEARRMSRSLSDRLHQNTVTSAITFAVKL